MWSVGLGDSFLQAQLISLSHHLRIYGSQMTGLRHLRMYRHFRMLHKSWTLRSVVKQFCRDRSSAADDQRKPRVTLAMWTTPIREAGSLLACILIRKDKRAIHPMDTSDPWVFLPNLYKCQGGRDSWAICSSSEAARRGTADPVYRGANPFLGSID